MSEEGAPNAANELVPDAPRERQTLRLSPAKLDSFREWATRGSGVTAAARVRDSDGRIALVRNSWSDGWILPGGAVEPGESPAEAARREVREETGLDATVREPLVVLDQSYVAEGGAGDSNAADSDSNTVADDSDSIADPDDSAGEERPAPDAVVFTARYVVYSASAEGEIPDASRLGVDATEISAARWFESLPEDLHDGDLLRPYL